jgi:excisionase family DNA binding protein
LSSCLIEVPRRRSVLAIKKLDPLYTVAETAEILNVSEKTVPRLIEDEVLRTIDFGREDGRRGAVRVAPADLEDFIRDYRSR